jgi:hypothetical protein
MEEDVKHRVRRAAILAAAAVSAVTVLMPAAAHATPAPGVPAGSFYTEVINRDSDKCMNVRHGNSKMGEAIQEYHCDHTPAAKFLFRAMGSDASGTEWYQVENQNSRYCLSPQSWVNAGGDPLIQFACQNSRYEMWKLVQQPFGYYELANRETGRCVAIPDWNRDDWTQLKELDCVAGRADQEWYLHLG